MSLDTADLAALAKVQKIAAFVRERADEVRAWCDETPIHPWIWERLPEPVKRQAPVLLPLFATGEIEPRIEAVRDTCLAIERAIEKILVA